MKIPTIAQAEAMLAQAQRMNPTPWVEHSRSTAVNARLIAERCQGLDPDAAYVLGLLHDIGRREGFTYIKHIWDGYHYLLAQGFEDAADICLTHSFPLPDMKTFMGRVDIPDVDYMFIQRFIEARAYTVYDRLIQLCDAVSSPEGGVLIDKRLLDVAMRYGANANMADKWKATFALKRQFDEMAGINIYKLLPNIVENTFKW